MTPDNAPSPFDPLAHRFEARGELGRGGMGRITDAYDRALARPVAIKEMLSASDVDFARFEREARITARLEHPGIVPIHDAGRAPDGTPFYVMRRVDGRPLDALIEPGLPSRLALIPNVLAACDAVAYAHARGVVHRDIKPTNILVGPFGETLVIDWGIAREIAAAEPGSAAPVPNSEPQLTRAGTVAGTPGFMAPEQARGESVDARADVFALGGTLFYVLSGRLPYGDASATTMVDLVGAGREPDWRQLPRAVPPDLLAITKKAMAPDSAERYPDAGALAADLRRFITGNLVGAYDYGVGARLVRFVRRHRAAVAVAAISAAIVVVVAALAVRRILAERDDANAERSRAEAAADRLLVQRARELADTDPVGAIIMLQTIGANPRAARDAWAAAEAAKVHGIPFGFSTRDATGVRLAKDGAKALVVGWRTGQVTEIDVAARRARAVSAHCIGASTIAWLGPDHALCSGAPARLVELTTGATTDLPFTAYTMWSDRERRAWVLVDDDRLLELDGPPDAAHPPRLIATGVRQAAATDDFSLAVFYRNDKWEVRTPDATVLLAVPPVARGENPGIAYVGQGRIAILADGVLYFWHVAPADGAKPAAIVGDGTYADPSMTYVVLLPDRTYALTAHGIVTLVGTRLVHTNPMVSMMQATHDGVAEVLEDGSLQVYDGLGWHRLRRRASGLAFGDAVPGGGMVAATTATGEVLLWDLRASAPRRAIVPMGWSLLELAPGALWLWSLSDGVARVDLATGRLDIKVPIAGTIYALAAHDGRWAAAGTSKAQLYFYDATTDQRFLADGPIEAADDLDGITVAHDDGTLWQWRPGDAQFHAAGAAGGHAERIAACRRWIAAVVGSQLVRVDTLTRRAERVPGPHDVDNIVVSCTGTVWALAARSVIAWPVGQPVPAKLPSSEPISAIGTDGEVLLMGTPRSITVVDADGPRVTPIPNTQLVWVGPERAVTETAQGEIEVTDLRTGLGFEIPDHASSLSPPIAYGDQIAAITETTAAKDQVISVWTIDVPRAPLALEAWLGTITNARPVAKSDAYTWPW